MKTVGFSRSQDVPANMDLHHYVLRGRDLHDRAVLGALARLQKSLHSLLARAFAAVPGDGKVKIAAHKRPSLQ